MTGVAAFRFCLGQQVVANRGMHFVTLEAAYVIEVVLTAHPVEHRMAVQTDP